MFENIVYLYNWGRGRQRGRGAGGLRKKSLKEIVAADYFEFSFSDE